MRMLFSTIWDGFIALLTLAVLALVGPAMFDGPPPSGLGPTPTQVAGRPPQVRDRPRPAAIGGPTVIRTALLRALVGDGANRPAISGDSDDPTDRRPLDASTISPRRGTPLPPGHTLVCDHNGCHEVCTTPHPMYSEESYTPSRYGETPRFTRCPTCSPSRAQLYWARRLPNYKRLRQDYTDNQIVHYLGSDRLRHLAGDYLPPELDPGRVRDHGAGKRP